MSAGTRPAIWAAAIGLMTMTAAGALPPMCTAARADDAVQLAADPGDIVAIRAHVVALDLQKRLVTLRGPDGRVVAVRAGEAIGNLDRVAKGDWVDLRYHEAVALELTKPVAPAPEAGPAESAASPAAGTPPAGVTDRHLTITGRVVGVDPGAHTLSLKAARGRARTFEVRGPLGRKVLESVSLGDSLTIVFAEAAAVAITPVPKG